MKTKQKMKCPKDKCLLSTLYHDSNVNMACDCKCYLTYCDKDILKSYETPYVKAFHKDDIELKN